MRKTLSLFFVLALLLAGCSQNDTLVNEGISSEQNSTSEVLSDTSFTSDMESKSSDQPFIIIDFKKPDSKYANAEITVQNQLGIDIDSPYLSFDFLDENYDIIASNQTDHLGIVSDGQSYTENIYFRDCADAKYIRLAYYSGDGISSQSVQNPQIFPLS